MSIQLGLKSSISLIFHSLFHFFKTFSRLIASFPSIKSLNIALTFLKFSQFFINWTRFLHSQELVCSRTPKTAFATRGFRKFSDLKPFGTFVFGNDELCDTLTVLNFKIVVR